MSTFAATDHLTLSEQSLLRSLSSIHHQHRSSPCITSDILHRRPSSPMSNFQVKEDRHNNEHRPKSILRRRTRYSYESSPRSSAAMPPLAKGFSELPFSKDGSLSQERSAKDFQRRHSHIRHQISGYRSDYSLGDTLCSTSHMVIEPTPKQAIKAVDSLKTHDFAFVKRSDGSYSFAILAYRSMEPTKRADGDADMRECMNFVICNNGSTKMVRRSHWSRSIRLVSMEGLDECHCQFNDTTTTKVAMEHSTTNTCASPALFDQHIKEQEIEPESIVDWVPPNMIAFVPHIDEKCSMMSSVSDRAMGL